MTNQCRLFTTEYSRNYRRQKLKPVEKIDREDGFEERIEEGQIDPRIASIPSKLDHDAEQLIRKHILDNQRSVYQVSYRNPWAPRHRRQIGKEETETEEKDFESELLAYVNDLYFNPHEEEILAPPVTTKRIFGYIRPKLLHGSLSMYQDTIGRTGMTIIQEHYKKSITPSENTKTLNKNLKIDSCNDKSYGN